MAFLFEIHFLLTHESFNKVIENMIIKKHIIYLLHLLQN